ncbi:MAG: hypothetical protein IJU62_03170 [Muribaculaceae bacterium]|nr:hypothetical protein [Muribaculaceae bacterium]
MSELDSIRTLLCAHNDSVNEIASDLSELRKLKNDADSITHLKDSLSATFGRIGENSVYLKDSLNKELTSIDSAISEAKKAKNDSLKRDLIAKRETFRKYQKHVSDSLEVELNACRKKLNVLTDSQEQIINRQVELNRTLSNKYNLAKDSSGINSIELQLLAQQNQLRDTNYDQLRKQHDVLIFNNFADTALLNPYNKEHVEIAKIELNKCLTQNYKDAAKKIIVLLTDYPKYQQETMRFIEYLTDSNSKLLDRIDRTFIDRSEGKEIIAGYMNLGYQRIRNEQISLWYLDDSYKFLDKLIAKLKIVKVGTDFINEKEEARLWLEEMRKGKRIWHYLDN